MQLIAKYHDTSLQDMVSRSPLNKKWLFGNETEDSLKYAFDAKRVVHPGVKGRMLAENKWQDNYHLFMSCGTGRKHKRAAYIHIPFCRTKCLYCGFFQNFSDQTLEDIYIDKLIVELRMSAASPFINSHPIHAVYLGGGTPSGLSAANIKRLLRAVNESLYLANDYELTFESRIHDFDDEKLECCLNGGVNRFSLGVQSFNTKIRKSLGRIADRQEVLKRLHYICSLDHAAVVIDLMYGLPNQSMEVWQDDVMTLINCGIDGGDLYQLNVYENSRLKKAIDQGKIAPAATIDTQAVMFKQGVELMNKHKAKRLSICHWAHNTREKNLYNSFAKSASITVPFGAGAGGKIDGHSMFVDRDIKSYMQRIDSGEKPLIFMTAPADNYKLYGAVTDQMEAAYLNLAKIKSDYNVDLKYLLADLFAVWQQKGLIEMNGDFVELTIAGQFWYINLTQAILDCLELLKKTDSL